jgi:hypothetical protein
MRLILSVIGGSWKKVHELHYACALKLKVLVIANDLESDAHDDLSSLNKFLCISEGDATRTR